MTIDAFIQTHGALKAGEETLLAGLKTLPPGQFVMIGDGRRPEANAGKARQIRADFLRALILGELGEATLPEAGLRLAGARITGELNLEGCRGLKSIELIDCHFDEAPVLRSAGIDNLILSGSLVPGLEADGLEARGDVFLRDVKAEGELRLLGAQLGGNLDCGGAKLTAGETGKALIADGLEARGGVFLRGVKAEGEVRLLGAKLGGDLDCVGAKLTAGKTGFALRLNRARIEGSFFLREGAKVDGGLDLTGAEIGELVDEKLCWPTQGNLILNRCRYGAFNGGAPVDAAARIGWLNLQRPAQFGEDFWPQPWEHCAKVLREMGHRADARAVLIDKERRQRAARRDRRRKELLFEDAGWHAVWDRILGITIRYGHQPLLAFAWLGVLWLAGLFVFAEAEALGAIKPNQPVVLRSPEWADCAEGGKLNTGTTQLDCFLAQPQAASYPKFSAFIYSVDTLLPIVDLEMQGYWIPDDRASGYGRFARGFLWAQIAMGWALSLLAVAGFSGLIRTDSR